MGATEDAAMRRFPAAAPPATRTPTNSLTSRRAEAWNQSSEMDAVVKGGVEILVFGHGGSGWCWGRATVVAATTTVTLRCAGRDRRTVSGRELPRTRVASRDRIGDVEGPPAGHGGRPAPAGGWVVGSGGGVGGEGLVGGGCPEEAGELAGDGGDGGAFPALGGEVVVAAVQADLSMPGAWVGGRVTAGSAGWVLVGPGGLDQQSAGVMVAGLGDVAAVALIAA